jgi:uncharacterized integral membrane protein
MPLLRLILLVGIAAGTLILARSNWQPMSIVFFGLRSPALPLTLWLVAAVLAGAATTLVVSALLHLTRLIAQRVERNRWRGLAGSRSARNYADPPFAANPNPPQTWVPPTAQVPQSAYRPAAEDEDDWERDADDWFEDEPADSRRDRPDFRPPPTYSSRPDPRLPNRPNTGNSVVDADYRVIVPPQRNLDDEP